MIWNLLLNTPLMEIGTATDETPGPRGVRLWKTSAPASQRLYSYALNNYWHTNYKADQDGPIAFRYAVEPHAGNDLGGPSGSAWTPNGPS